MSDRVMGFDLCVTGAKMVAEEVKRRLACGDFVLVEPEKARSEVWKNFDRVHNENNKPVGYAQCKK